MDIPILLSDTFRHYGLIAKHDTLIEPDLITTSDSLKIFELL